MLYVVVVMLGGYWRAGAKLEWVTGLAKPDNFGPNPVIVLNNPFNMYKIIDLEPSNLKRTRILNL